MGTTVDLHIRGGVEGCQISLYSNFYLWKNERNAEVHQTHCWGSYSRD